MISPDKYNEFMTLPQFVELWINGTEMYYHFKASDAPWIGPWFTEGVFVDIKPDSPLVKSIPAGVYKVVRRTVAFYGDRNNPEAKHVEGSAYLLIMIDPVAA